MAELEFDAVVKERQAMERLLASSPGMQKQLQAIIRKVIAQARTQVSRDAKQALPNDPRRAYRAVRSAVYRRILGGQVNILNQRKRHAPTYYQPPRTLRAGQRGGNRRKPNPKTARLDSYSSQDRGFILRWIDAGTKVRHISFIPNEARGRWNLGSQGGPRPRSVNTGDRGRITGIGWFRTSSHKALVEAGDMMDKLIEEAIRQEMAR